MWGNSNCYNNEILGHLVVGIGNHEYWSNYGYENADFGNTAYDWAEMPKSAGNSRIQELMYHIGVSMRLIMVVKELLLHLKLVKQVMNRFIKTTK